jgi:hypothetical protein
MTDSVHSCNTNEWDEMARTMAHAALRHESIPSKYGMGAEWKGVEPYKDSDQQQMLRVTVHAAVSEAHVECKLRRVNSGALSGPYFHGTVTVRLTDVRPPQPVYAFACSYNPDLGLKVESIERSGHHT